MIPVRFSVFQPFEAELGTNRQSDTVNSTNSKKDINKSEETEKSKSRGESSEISSGKKTDGNLSADRESTGKFIKNEKRQKSGSTKSSIVPRKSSTQSRSGRENGTEKGSKAAPKREFRRSLSSDSSVSSRPSSGGRETVAEKILRYHNGLACIVNKAMFSILTFKSVDENVGDVLQNHYRQRSAKNLGRGLATPNTKNRVSKSAAVPRRSILKAPGRERSKMRKTLIFASPSKDATKRNRQAKEGEGKVNYGSACLKFQIFSKTSIVDAKMMQVCNGG